MYLGDVDDPLTRRALEAASVVRRVTHSLLRAMLPEAVHLGGPNTVGLMTLLGFLSAVAFKLLE